jgi:hypothetical protein
MKTGWIADKPQGEDHLGLKSFDSPDFGTWRAPLVALHGQAVLLGGMSQLLYLPSRNITSRVENDLVNDGFKG